MSTSCWTGTVKATVSIGGKNSLQCTFQGTFNIVIFLGGLPPAMNRTPPPPSPAPPNTLGGTIKGAFTANINVGGGQDVVNGSGNADLFIGGYGSPQYDPMTHTIQFAVTMTGGQATGTEALAGGAPKPFSTDLGGYLGDFAKVIQQPTSGAAGLDQSPEASFVSGSVVDTGGPNGPFYISDAIPITAGGVPASIVLDLQKSGAQTVVQTDDGATLGPRTTTWMFTLDPYAIQVELDQAELDPTVVPTSAQLTVTVKNTGQNPAGANNAAGTNVSIDVLTQAGGVPGPDPPQNDGHIHDAGRNPSDRSRPTGQLTDDNGQVPGGAIGTTYHGADFPIVAVTDQSGQVKMTYYPPQALNPPRPGTFYISGHDIVKAELQTAPCFSDQKDINTKVDDLALMLAGNGYQFGAQPAHPNMFYGTAETNDALAQIASIFQQQQTACQGGGVYNQHNYNIAGNPISLTITAMSLPWGGLNDIGHAPYGAVWNPPHYTHHTGKVADLDLGVFQTGGVWDLQRINLLADIIIRQGGTLPYQNEGRDFGNAIAQGIQIQDATHSATLNDPRHHFHVQFP